jgi:uncharacterized coiled-coil protein SlyX
MIIIAWILSSSKVETSVEQRIARLEERTAHIQSDVTELKADLRRIEAKLGDKVDANGGRIDAIREALATFRLEMKDEIAAIKLGRLLDKIWWLLIAAAQFGVMARGFKWI